MSTPAPPMPRHRIPRPSSAEGLSRSTWRRVRQMLTVGVFVVTTAAAVTIGLNGAAVSPVAPALAASVSTSGSATVIDGGPAAHHGHGPHR